jgi:glycerol uptake facilitator-like aquaporin
MRCGLYTLAQCLGAIMGVAFACSMSKAHFWETNGGANVVNSQVGAHQAFGGEILCTWLLVTVVLSATNPALQSRYVHQVSARVRASACVEQGRGCLPCAHICSAMVVHNRAVHVRLIA